MKELEILLEKMKGLGLGQYSINMNREFLEYGEYGLCLGTLAEHLYEDNIAIDVPTYELIMSLIDKMNLLRKDYLYLEELKNK